MMLITVQTPEQEVVINLEIFSKSEYYTHEHICAYMLICLDVQICNPYEAMFNDIVVHYYIL